jgi:hypothetical protein
MKPDENKKGMGECMGTMMIQAQIFLHEVTEKLNFANRTAASWPVLFWEEEWT